MTSEKSETMVSCQTQINLPQAVGEPFFIQWKDKEYSCSAFKANGRILYRINFMGSYLCITKTINQHGIPFWTSIPQDLKLRHIVIQLGKQLEDHLIEALCAITTVSK